MGLHCGAYLRLEGGDLVVGAGGAVGRALLAGREARHLLREGRLLGLDLCARGTVHDDGL
jgi:hypothetical protein